MSIPDRILDSDMDRALQEGSPMHQIEALKTEIDQLQSRVSALMSTLNAKVEQIDRLRADLSRMRAVCDEAWRFRADQMPELYRTDAPADSWWVALHRLTDAVDAYNAALTKKETT